MYLSDTLLPVLADEFFERLHLAGKVHAFCHNAVELVLQARNLVANGLFLRSKLVLFALLCF